jgi:hypothetical protein
VLLGMCLVGVLVVFVIAARSARTQSFTIGVTPAGAVAKIGPGDEACQAPITIPDEAAAFDRVVVGLGTYGRPGPELAVTVKSAAGGAAIARGRLAGGYADFVREPSHVIAVGHVDAREPLSVCLRNSGSSAVGIYGNGGVASRTSRAIVNGAPVDADFSISFERRKPRSALSLLGPILDRASLWRASWTGAWLYVLLTLVVVAGVPALLVVALRDATRE